MKHLANIYIGQSFKVNGITYTKTREEHNMVEAYDWARRCYTCFWIWTNVTE